MAECGGGKEGPTWLDASVDQSCILRELCHPKGISFISSLFGELLRMDGFTANMSKMRFTRVRVMINADFSSWELMTLFSVKR